MPQKGTRGGRLCARGDRPVTERGVIRVYVSGLETCGSVALYPRAAFFPSRIDPGDLGSSVSARAEILTRCIETARRFQLRIVSDTHGEIPL